MYNPTNRENFINQNATDNQLNKKNRVPILTTRKPDQFDRLSPDPYLVKNLMLRRGLTMLYGPSNSGKTSIAMDLAMSIACEKPWAGLKTEKSRVFYVDSDANRSCENNLIAAPSELFDDAGESTHLHFITDTVNLVNKGHSFEILTNTIDELSCDEVPGLIILDSLSACMTGADVNNPADISSVLETLHELQTTYGLAILLVQNTGKDSSGREPGHSSLRAAIDTSIAVSTTFGENPRKLVITKQRDIEKIDPLWFDLKVATVDCGRYGSSINYCVVHTPDR